jgi:hypothetical protein
MQQKLLLQYRLLEQVLRRYPQPPQPPKPFQLPERNPYRSQKRSPWPKQCRLWQQLWRAERHYSETRQIETLLRQQRLERMLMQQKLLLQFRLLEQILHRYLQR